MELFHGPGALDLILPKLRHIPMPEIEGEATMLSWLVHHVYHSACLTCAIETSWLFQI